MNTILTLDLIQLVCFITSTVCTYFSPTPQNFVAMAFCGTLYAVSTIKTRIMACSEK